MSESEVSHIRDEDVLRRMWQQTEDFSRKKEIRAHMYKLREERLRDLYSPEPGPGGKGCEFTSEQGHVKSFADQNFQSMKSKEVRDAGSPPKEFTYRGQDLKELSNAGWNVESENRTTDDGHTHVKSVNANIEGRYDVEGGRGQFAAVDRQRQATTEYHDDNSSLHRNETSSDSAAHEHVVRQTDDGTRISSTTSSSNTSSKFQQVSSTKHETVPYLTDDDYDLARSTARDTDRNQHGIRITNRNNYEQNNKNNDVADAELVSRKIEYPDDNTKVIVETRCLQDGTRVTSTRREFRVPAQTTHSETRSESKLYSSQHKSDIRDSTSKTTRRTLDKRSDNIVDSQRNVDDNDFQRQVRQYTVKDNSSFADTHQHYVTKTDKKITDYTKIDDDFSEKSYKTKINNNVIDYPHTDIDTNKQTQHRIIKQRNFDEVDEANQRHVVTTRDHDTRHKIVKETRQIYNTEESSSNITDSKNTEKKFHHISKDETPSEKPIRDIQKDKSELEGKIYDIPQRKESPNGVQSIPKAGTVQEESFRDMVRERIVKDDIILSHTPSEQIIHVVKASDLLTDHTIPTDISNHRMVTNDRVHNVTNDIKVQEVFERKTSNDYYQTTYQNDFQSRKISTDLSPTHQAWASTLRSDTPTTTRPSTRASSPGSKTFKSSTSSLRSSVSPDKSVRKPLSRGGSPNKIDRYSPTRTVISDRHSTYSTTEVKANKTTSPERKPPTGRSPARSGDSPERKPQDIHHRTNTSPEKKSRNVSASPSSSPERRSPQKSSPIDVLPGTTSPLGKKEKSRSPVGHRQSPGKKITRQPSDELLPDTRPRNSPSRSTVSPVKNLCPNRSSPKLSPSPDRKSRFDKPEDSSTVSKPKTPSPSRPLCAADNDLQKSGTNSDKKLHQQQPYISDHKTPNTNKVTKITEDHYRFVDEETKMYTRLDQTNDSITHDKSQSSTKKSPSKSPTRQKDTTPENDVKSDKTCETIKVHTYTNKDTENNNAMKTSQKDEKNQIYQNTPNREVSPSKYGTYDKKKTCKVVPSPGVTIISTTDNKNRDMRCDSSNPRANTLPKNVSDIPMSPGNKSRRDSTSPIKSPTKEIKNTVDFLSKEITTEQVNKTASTIERPRQLVTPSCSPTRKPKNDETEASTGQSSPTTSVSGFVYYGSPRTEKPMVTDLDEFCLDSADTIKRPQTLEVKRSPSPSKLPCRSPSPEKDIPTKKNSLPRKSSLKKPSTDIQKTSPIEKPPTSFRVSPSVDKPDISENETFKKLSPSKPETGEPEIGKPEIVNRDSTFKPKPPLQRRETYEDRCKKILGMINDTTTESEENIKEKNSMTHDLIHSSSSVSPCGSPTRKDSSLFSNSSNVNSATMRTIEIDVNNFITHEQGELTKTSTSLNKNKSRKQLRENSPMKTHVLTNINNEDDSHQHKKIPESKPREILQKRPSGSPERKPVAFESRPSHGRASTSPERKSTPKYLPKVTSPSREVLNLTKTITSVTSQLDEVLTKTDMQKTAKKPEEVTKTLKHSRVLKSPTRDIPEQVIVETNNVLEKNHAHTTSLTKMRKDESPVRKATSPNRSSEQSYPLDSHLICDDIYFDDVKRSIPQQSPEKESGYLSAITSNYVNTSATENINAIRTIRTQKNENSNNKYSSPTRQSTQDVPRSSSPTKPLRSDSSPQQKVSKDTSVKKSNNQEPKSSLVSKDRKTADSTVTTTIVTEDFNNITNTKAVEKQKISVPDSTHTSSPTKPTHHIDNSVNIKSSPHQKPLSSANESPSIKSEVQYSKAQSTTQADSENIVPGYMKLTTSVISKYEKSDLDSTISRDETIISKSINKTNPISKKSDSLEREIPKRNETESNKNILQKRLPEKISQIGSENQPRSRSPGKPIDKSSQTFGSSSDQKTRPKPPVNKHSISTPEQSTLGLETPSYMKSTVSMASKFDTNITSKHTQEIHESNLTEREIPSPKTSNSPDAFSHDNESAEDTQNISELEEPRHLRTPSPTKNNTKVIDTSTDFIISEREQEILNKVQKSLRKLSPERTARSPNRERSPTKTTTSLQELDIITTDTIHTNNETSQTLTIGRQSNKTSKTTCSTESKNAKPSVHKAHGKPISRNTSPIKRVPSTSNREDDRLESPTKSRSISPKKHVSHVERPQSPQVPKVSGIKPREQIPPHLTRKPTPATLVTTKIEKLTTDIKKSNEVTKQNILTKTITPKSIIRSIPSPTTKCSESEYKRAPTPKGIKENGSPKKDNVTRTISDVGKKTQKTSSPQRMKSKPEIQISDMSTKSPKFQKLITKPHSKLPSKPKSATALNTSPDDDDIIIDVQQSKSSRENSPDRICPTPVNFSEDIGEPRFPDEVSEPDDNIIKRKHHIIQETESVVDDIVEICEDEELFVKNLDTNIITEHDDSLLSVNDKVNKFTNKNHFITTAKDATASFKDTEKRVHSDLVSENLKSDECLLTVSEKVNKFAKGPRYTTDSRSPSRKITDEYDNDTIYQDNYTKLSVNDKAHLFVETAENVKVTKVKPIQKLERPDLSNVDESLKSDNCLLSVSDKVSKFVKTAEQYFTESQFVEETENKINEQHDKIIKQIVDSDDEIYNAEKTIQTEDIDVKTGRSLIELEDKSKLYQPKIKDYGSPNAKPAERSPAVKITALRSSEAVKKAKALFENIATTQKTMQNDSSATPKTAKLTDIGVIKKSPKSDSTTILHPSSEGVFPCVTDLDTEVDSASSGKDGLLNDTKPQYPCNEEKIEYSPNHLSTQSPDVLRNQSPMRKSVEVTTTKILSSKHPASEIRAESPRQRPESPRQQTHSPRERPDTEKSDRIPGYLKPTKTSQIKEETKATESSEVSSRRGSGKFGVELRRTSVERSTVSSERRRSVEHHQPCIEDIFDLDLLEQMLEKVSGYEQRRRIRAQIRVSKTQSEQIVDTNTHTRTRKQITITKNRSSEQKVNLSPDRTSQPNPQPMSSPEQSKTTISKTISEVSQRREPAMNGYSKEPVRNAPENRQRPLSPEKAAPKSTLAPRTPARQPSPDKRRMVSPSKTAPKPKGNRFNEYASAYMKKVGLKESDSVKFSDSTTKKPTDTKKTAKHEGQQQTVEEFTSTKSLTERNSSKEIDYIELVQTNVKRSPSPVQRLSKVQFPERTIDISERTSQSLERRAQSPVRKAQSPSRRTQVLERTAQSPELRSLSPEQKAQSPERLHQRTPSPDFKRSKTGAVKETTTKTVYDIEKKLPSKPIQEEKPSWVTNRNLKKITSDTRTYSSKKIENEKPKYRAPSPSKVISKPIDVITSSYGPGPLDADGKPLFGIKALRNGATNFQVKGTVIRQEFHSRNGGAPEGSVSVTAYSTRPEELEQLLAARGEPPSRIHGLAAITTTASFGGDTGLSLSNVHTREDRASLEQFTHHDRRVETVESRTYDTMTHGLSEENKIEEILEKRKEDISETTRRPQVSESNRRMESKKDDYTDRKDSKKREERVTEVKRGQKVEERREKVERREDKKTVRQSSVKSLTEKYIKSAHDSGKSARGRYPKAGLILRTTALRESVSSDDALPAGLERTDSEHSLGSVEDAVFTTTERSGDAVRTTTTTRTHHHGPAITTHTRGSTTITHHEPVITTQKTSTVITQAPVITHRVISHEPVVQTVTRGHGISTSTSTTTGRSFLDSNTKVTGVQDILSRMKNADIAGPGEDSAEEAEARALLNKFLGATVLMAGMQGHVAAAAPALLQRQETIRSSNGAGTVTSHAVEELDLDQCWDERLLKQLLEECTEYEQRRRIRARIRTLMAEQEACASAVTEALGAEGGDGEGEGGNSSSGAEAREEKEVTVTSSVTRDSSDKTVSSSVTTTTSKVIEMTRPAPKPVSPFAKFRQLEKQNSTNSPNSPKTPQSPGSPSASQPYFKFTDPALHCSALTIKERLLQWCRDKTRDYENVKLENFSTSWADGLAFCALVHHFLPDAFDYSKLTADRRRHNFTLAFKVADEKAGIYPLLDVDDMVAMRKPDWKCVFTYVQAIYRRFKDEQ